ncbi:hypothetical protein SteCoe_6637 [Stentor coeruleus]|uniref:Uncharacterized protein n=1 Tax=Stentor coeruleus TaxID=5963 RepID=A0A1R2CPE8_9CILI|nr:hypothetical protein SteCoe_6637 [Stentor coeruleus]
MKVQLLKAEGNWVDSCLGCYISVNNNLVDVITPLNSIHDTNIFEVPSTGLLRIILKDMGNTEGYVASLSMQINLLPSFSGHWLPLFENPSSDLLSHLVDEVKSPRIMFFIHSDMCDDEIFLTHPEIQTENISEIVLASEISFTKDNDQELIATSHFNCPLDIMEQKKHQDIIEILTSEIDNYQECLGKEKDTNKSLRERIDNLLVALKSQNDRAVTRENSLLELISDKEKEICTILEMNRSLKQSNRKLEIENKNIYEKCERLSFAVESLQSIEKQCNYYQQLLKNTEINNEKLVNTVMELSKVACAEYFDVENVIRNEENEKDHRKNTEGVRVSNIPENVATPEKKYQDIEKINGFIEVVTEQISDFIDKVIGKMIKIEQLCKIDEFTVRINDYDVEFAMTKDGVWIRSGQNLIEAEDFWIKKRKNQSETLFPNNNPVFLNDNMLENAAKKVTQRVSPKKSILKPVNMLSRYKTALSKPLLKDTKITDGKKNYK